jgi:hypothetical protein
MARKAAPTWPRSRQLRQPAADASVGLMHSKAGSIETKVHTIETVVVNRRDGAIGLVEAVLVNSSLAGRDDQQAVDPLVRCATTTFRLAKPKDVRARD